MSQSELAKECGISQGYLSQLESVSTQDVCNNPSVDTALRIALALDVPLVTLLGYIGYSEYAGAMTTTQQEVTKLRRIIKWYRKGIRDLADEVHE